MEFVDTLMGRESTIKSQKFCFEKRLQRYLPLEQAKVATEEDLKRIIHNLRYANLSAGTIKIYLNVLKKYIEWAGGPSLPFKKYNTLLTKSEQKKDIKVLTKEELNTLLETAKRSRFYLAFLLASHAGLRKGEVFGLQIGDIDFTKNTITISRSFNGPTKNGKSRIVPLSNRLKQDLMARKVHMMPKRINLFKGGKYEINECLTNLCKEAKVPKVTFHGLRHTFATLALDSGKSIRVVANTLGHSNVSTTIDIYWKNTGEQLNMDFLD